MTQSILQPGFRVACFELTLRQDLTTNARRRFYRKLRAQAGRYGCGFAHKADSCVLLVPTSEVDPVDQYVVEWLLFKDKVTDVSVVESHQPMDVLIDGAVTIEDFMGESPSVARQRVMSRRASALGAWIQANRRAATNRRFNWAAWTAPVFDERNDHDWQ